MVGTARADLPLAARTRRGRRDALLVGTALQAAVLCLAAQAADAQPAPNARPTGGQVVAGAASIAAGPTTTTITQSTHRAAIDWHSFDVGRNQSVNFRQPSATSLTLNRVTGPDPSAIAGRITANGGIIITNRSGIVFYPGAEVNATSVVVSAPGITNRNLMAGKLVFDQPAKPGAAVVNQGNITVREAGLAGLVAPQVRNSGTITAKLGHVVLAGAAAATLDLYGDGLLAIDVTRRVTTTPAGHAALVTNTGVIDAAGGTVQLSAAAADGVVSALVDGGGTITAPSVGARTGTIAIRGTGGALEVEGTLLAEGTAPGTKGGAIEVAGAGRVDLAPTARVSASGSAGGGVVALGTSIARARGGQGVTPDIVSGQVTVAPGARIAADATGAGNGGHVTVLSSQATAMGGRITARGGPEGGAGGLVEVSGEGGFALTGPVDVTAPHGTAGTILLDPYDLIVISSTSLTGYDLFIGGTTLGIINGGTSAGTSSVISDSAINILRGDVKLQAANNLSFVYSGADQPNAVNLNYALTLQAGNEILIDRGWTLTTGRLTIQAGYNFPTVPATGDGAIVLGSTIGAGAASAPAVTLDSHGAGWPLTLLSDIGLGNGGIALNDTVIGQGHAAGTVSIGALKGGIVQTGGRITADTLTGDVADAAFRGANAVSNVGPFTAYPLGFVLDNTVPLTVAGPVVAGRIDISNQHTPITLTGNLNAASINLLSTGGSIVQTAGTLTAEILTGSAGSAALTSANAVSNLGRFTTMGGDFVLTDSRPLTVSGPLSAGNIFIQTSSPIGLNIAGTLTATTAATGRVSLIADGLSRSYGGNVVAPGSVELAPYSMIPVEIGYVPGSLLIDSNFLAGVTTGNLLIGGYTNVLNNATAAVAHAPRVSVVSPVTLSGPGEALTIVASEVDVGASLTAPGNITLSGLGGSLSLAADVRSDGDISLWAALGISQSAGSLVGRVLTVSAGRSATLTGSNDVTTLGRFDTEGSFTFNNSGPLTVAGPVSGLPDPISITGSGDLTVSGALSISRGSPGNISLRSGRDLNIEASLTAPGNITLGPVAGSLSLAADVRSDGDISMSTGLGISQSAGSLVGRVLTVGAKSATLTGSNDVTTLGRVNTDGRFTFNNSGPLTVAGPVLSIGGIGIANEGPVTLAGGITTADYLDLVVTGGSIAQTTGTLTAGTLTGSADSAAFPGANAVRTLGSFTTAGSFVLNNADPLTVAGPVSAGNIFLQTTSPIGLNIAGALTATGRLSLVADSMSRTAGTIVAPASVELAPYTRIPVEISKLAPPDSLLITPDFLAGVTTGNLLIGGYTHVLNNATAAVALAPRVSVVSPVTLSGPGEALTIVAGNVDVGASLTAPGNIKLAAGQGGLAGSLSLAADVRSDGDISLSADPGISQSAGSLIGRILTVDAGRSATLTGSNDVTTLGRVNTDGRFTFNNSGPLTVAGPVLSIGGIGIANEGPVTLAGGITTADYLDLVVTGGSIVQTAGTLTAGTLTGSADSAAFTGANAVRTLGSFTTAGSFVLNNADLLTVLGPVTAGSVGLTVTAQDTLGRAMLIDGPVQSGPGGTIDLAAPSILVASLATISAEGPIIYTGSLTAPPGTTSGGKILLTTDTLGVATGTATVAPVIQAPSGLIAIAPLNHGNTSGVMNTLRVDATQSPATGVLSLFTGFVPGGTSGAGAISVSNIAEISTAGSLGPGTLALGSTNGGAVISAGSVAIATGLNLSRIAGTLALYATGAVSETGGTVNVATLTGQAGSASLRGANTVAMVGSFSTTGGFNLDNGSPLTVTGPIVAGSTVGIANQGSVTLAGDMTAPSVNLVSTAGGIVQIAGTLSADVLTGGAFALAQFGSSAPGPLANVGTLAGFVVSNGKFSLANAQALTVDGLSAANFSVTAPRQITLAGGTIATTGQPVDAQKGSKPADPGSYFLVKPAGGVSSFVQTGTTKVQPLGSSDATLRIDVGAGGTIKLGNLVAPAATLVLGATTASATGSIDVGRLLVLGGNGSSVLFGTVAGLTGPDAAATSEITPGVNVNYLLNYCVIGSASCVIVPNPFIGRPYLPPPLSPIVENEPTLDQTVLVAGPEEAALARVAVPLRLAFPPALPGEANPTLVLPGVAGRDY